MIGRMLVAVIFMALQIATACADGGQLSSKTLAQFKSTLTAGQVAFLQANPDVVININDKSGSFSPMLHENVIPYPEPKTGEEAMWNHLRRYRGEQMSRVVKSTARLQDNSVAEKETQEEYSFHYIKEQEIYQRVVMLVKKPSAEGGEWELVYRHSNQHADEVWQYLPTIRRRRIAPTYAYDFQLTPANIKTVDSLDMFSGSLDRFDWNLLGEKELYVPITGIRQALDTSSAHYDLDHLPEWTLRKVIVVEATLKQGQTHKYPKRIYYLDKDSGQILFAEQYDADNSLAQFAFVYTEYSPDQKVILPIAELTFDMKQYERLSISYEQYKLFPGNMPSPVVDSFFTLRGLYEIGCCR